MLPRRVTKVPELWLCSRFGDAVMQLPASDPYLPRCRQKDSKDYVALKDHVRFCCFAQLSSRCVYKERVNSHRQHYKRVFISGLVMITTTAFVLQCEVLFVRLALTCCFWSLNHIYTVTLIVVSSFSASGIPKLLDP